MGRKSKEQLKKPGVIKSFAGSLEEALDEDISEIQQEDVIVVDAPHIKKKKDRKKALYFVLGVVILAFAVVGIAQTIIGAVQLVRNITSNEGLINEFDLFLFPVVSVDTPTFEQRENLPNSTIITASIAKIMLVNDTSKYSVDTGMMYVPEFDIETNAVSIFGAGTTITHETVRAGQNVFSYDEEKKVYAIPDGSVKANYEPRITEMTNIGETYTLTVDYMPPTVSIPGLENKHEPIKTIIFTVTKTGDKKTVTQMKFAENSGTHGDTMNTNA